MNPEFLLRRRKVYPVSLPGYKKEALQHKGVHKLLQGLVRVVSLATACVYNADQETTHRVVRTVIHAGNHYPRKLVLPPGFEPGSPPNQSVTGYKPAALTVVLWEWKRKMLWSLLLGSNQRPPNYKFGALPLC